MRYGAIISLGASAALGLGALFVARVWLPGQDARAQAPQPEAPAGVPVVLAASPIAYGQKLEAKSLVLARLPREALPEGAYGSIDEVLKLDKGGAPVALAPLAAREPVLASKVSGAGARPTLSAMISDGMRAYTIGVTEVAGGGGHVVPGDRVDVVLTRKLSGDPAIDGVGGASSLVSEVVLQNVKVLGMDLNADPGTVKPAVARTATLEVTLEDAGRLALAAEAGDLSLALRRTGSAETAEVRPVRASDLGKAAARPAAAPVRSPRPARARSEAASGVVVVHGDERARVSVPAERG